MARYRFLLTILVAISVACTTIVTPSPIPQTTTSTPTKVNISTATMVAPTKTPEPTPTAAPRKLVICTGSEPDSLYLYGTSMYISNIVQEAIYDGPIDSLGFDYQPVILEKLPSLADGDARLEPVVVKEGDLVMNDDGNPVALKTGEKVRPFGCNTSLCAIAWDGELLEMSQLSAVFTLLEGITWSDGEPLTASVSVYSFKIAQDCEDPWMESPCGDRGITSRTGTTQLTASYQALDDRTIRWVGMPGYMDPGYMVNFFSPLPKHHLSRYQPDQLYSLNDAARTPMGWGPYILEHWETGKEMRFTKKSILLPGG